ncbi:MAG: hypothetical protein HYV25_00955, partial [Candidatus Harrisonbacteria bacterium]|nr:hypothetical protein [Candidatus Harrisonbacteria bacterium]
ASKPEVARTGKITLSAVPSAAPAEHAAAETKSVFNNEPNATQEIAKKLAQEVIRRNPLGPGPAGAQKLNLVKPSEVVDRFISDAMQNFDPDAFRPRVALADLRIIPDSKETFETYLRELRSILTTAFAGVPFTSMNDLPKMDFAAALPAYEDAVKRLLALPVPQSLAVAHQQEISLVKGQANMMRLLARYEEDPLAAYMALSAGAELNSGFASLNEDIARFITDHQLAI